MVIINSTDIKQRCRYYMPVISAKMGINEDKLEELCKNIYYSDKYYDDEYEYRHVVLPKELLKYVPKTHLMSEQEWRNIGVQQSKGWVHYMTHAPEPHILLFKRPITTQPTSE